MKRIRLICFGDSERNLMQSLQHNVIGTKKKVKFESDEELYFVVKIDGEWKISARAEYESHTDVYPFNDGNAYFTYSVKNIVRCQPFAIKSVCQQYLGSYWGLKLQQPTIIESIEFIESIEKLFLKNIK